MLRHDHHLPSVGSRGHLFQSERCCPRGQMEKLHNQILDKSSSTRDELGEVAANISLGSAYMTMWQKFEPDSAALMAGGTAPDPQSMDGSGTSCSR